MTGGRSRLSDRDYREILALRDRLRRFLAWSEAQAKEAGLTATQHQLLLAVRGHPGPEPPTIGDVAEHLQLRHHSAVGLVDRAAAAGLVARVADADDRRIVRLRLLPAGERALEHLTELHLTELQLLAKTFAAFRPGAPPPEPHLGGAADPAEIDKDDRDRRRGRADPGC